MQYNKRKHLKLLKSSQKSEKPRKILSDEEFLKLLESRPDENFFELEAYSAMMIAHLHWQNREQYFELIEQFLNGPINFLDLRKKYRSISDAVERLKAELILLDPVEPYNKAFGFTELINEIIMLFDRYCPDPRIREDYEFSEEELKNLIQKIFIGMKNRYP